MKRARCAWLVLLALPLAACSSSSSKSSAADAAPRGPRPDCPEPSTVTAYANDRCDGFCF